MSAAASSIAVPKKTLDDRVTGRVRHDDRVTGRVRHDDRVTGRVRHDDRVTGRVRHDDRVTGRVRHDDRVTGRVRHDDRVTGRVRHDDRVTGRVRHDDRVTGRVRHDDRVTGRVRHDDRVTGRVRHGSKPGVSTVLSSTEEDALESYLIYMANRGFPLTCTMVKAFAWSIAKKFDMAGCFNEEYGPGEKWWLLLFKQRHPRLSLRSRQKSCRSFKSFNSERML